MADRLASEAVDDPEQVVPLKTTQDFLRLYSLHQRQIHAFIGSFFRDSADIDEVLQETSIVLWSKFAEFRCDGEFLRWACGVARLEVLRHLRTKGRKSSALPLDEPLIELLAEQRETAQSHFDLRREALTNCLAKLRLQDRKLIEDCYKRGVIVKAIAERMSRPVNAVYQSLSRIRRYLHECITRSLKAKEM